MKAIFCFLYVGAFLAGSSPLYAGEIHSAVKAADQAKVAALLSTRPSLARETAASGATPLHIAASVKHAGIAQLLLDKGAAVDTVTDKGYTPLHMAAYSDGAGVAALLLKAGADFSARTAKRATPLYIAVNRESRAVIKLLITRTHAIYTDRFVDSLYLERTGEKAQASLQRAYAIFNDFFRADPQNENISFAVGLTCFAMKEYGRARFMFDHVLELNPKNDRARVDLALTHMAMNQPDLAREQFEKVLSHNPPPEARRSIEQWLKRLKGGKRKWRFFFRADGGWFDDDNVNVGPESDQVSISPIIFGSQVLTALSIDEESQPIEATGVFGSGAVSGNYDPGERAKWLLVADASYYQNWLDDADDYESIFGQVAFGAKHIGSRSMLALPVKVAHIIYGQEPLMTMYGISPSFYYVYGDVGEFHWITTSSVEFRDYDELDDRDGLYLSLGETVKCNFGKKGHNVAMGVTLFYDQTKEPVYEHIGLSWRLTGEFRLPAQTTLYSRIGLTKTKYAEQEVLAPEKREDRQHQFVIGLTKRITQRWGVDVNHQVSDSNSTFGLYQYDRQITTVSTFYAF